MPDTHPQLSLYDAHGLEYDRRLFSQHLQSELEGMIAEIIVQEYAGATITDVAIKVIHAMVDRFPVRIDVLADGQALLMRRAIQDCLIDWHMDLGDAPSELPYWKERAPEILRRVAFVLMPESFQLKPDDDTLRILGADRKYLAEELFHHYYDYTPYTYARNLLWAFLYERYPRETRNLPMKTQIQLFQTIERLISEWRENHRNLTIDDYDSSWEKRALNESLLGNVLLLVEACENLADLLSYILMVAIKPGGFRLPGWQYTQDEDREDA